MAIPATPITVGQTITGKTSWFGGPNDPSAQGTPASGIPITTPGIAVYNRATLGGWWRVKFPNGKTVDLRQTDLGPAPFTGRAVDVTYSALGAAGYNEQNFPTDGTVTATYLGKTTSGQPPAAAVAATPGTALALTSTPAAAASSGAGGDLFGAHHSELLYAAVWIGALTMAAYLLWTGLNRSTHGAPARAVGRAARVAA